MFLTQATYACYSGGKPEQSTAPSTRTAGEPCPDLTHTERPGKIDLLKGGTTECENTPCLWCDVLIRTLSQYSSSKEEPSLLPRKLKQYKLQGERTTQTSCLTLSL